MMRGLLDSCAGADPPACGGVGFSVAGLISSRPTASGAGAGRSRPPVVVWRAPARSSPAPATGLCGRPGPLARDPQPGLPLL